MNDGRVVLLVTWSVLGIFFYLDYLDTPSKKNNWQRAFAGLASGIIVFPIVIIYYNYRNLQKTWTN